MPIYLVHGFRWPREGFTGIRVHAIVHNLEGCSAEYIQNANSRSDILKSFRLAFPDLMKHLEGPNRTLEFIEQYDPEDESNAAVIQPWAFVADRVVMMAGGVNASEAIALLDPSANRQGQSQPVRSGGGSLDSNKTKSTHTTKSSISRINTSTSVMSLSLNLEDVIAAGPGLSSQAWEALADLRDKIAEGEKIGWWIVYNGDPERAYPSDSEDDDESEEEDEDLPETVEDEVKQERQKDQTPITAAGQTTSLPSREKELPSVPPPPPPPQHADPSQRPSHKVPTKSRSQTFIPRIPKLSSSPDKDKPKEKEIAVSRPGVNTRPEADLVVPEPAKLKEISKSTGLRKKFFGRKA